MDQDKIRLLLRRALVECFSEGELRTLCFDLGVDYDGLTGDGKTDKARELVAHFWRRGHMITLLQVVESLRPDTRWSKKFRQVLRDATLTTQEIPHIQILKAMGKTGPLGIDSRTLLAMNQKLDRFIHLAYAAVGIGVLALLISLLMLVLG